MFEKQLEIDNLIDQSDQNKPSSYLKPSPPFLWPEPRVFENSIDYDQYPPFHHLLESSQSICGVISVWKSSNNSMLLTYDSMAL